MNSDIKNVVKAAGTVGFATLISRIAGFIRDMLIAGILGTGLTADAFFVAFRIPNLLRRLLGEGAMSASFIPVFTEYLHIKERSEAWKLANIIFTLLLVIFTIITILGIVFSAPIVKCIAPGFTNHSEKFNLTVQLTRIMFPFIFFIGLASFTMGALNSLKIFFIPALSSFFFNLTIIFSAIFFTFIFSPPIALSIGVLLGGFFQFIVQLPGLLKKGFKIILQINLKHPGVKKIGLLFLPTLIGIAPHQINILVDSILASLLKEGSVSYLYYGNRLMQFPLGIFGIAISTAILPTLSEQIAKKDFIKVKDTFAFAIKFVMLITIPAALGLIILRYPIIKILFENGKFSQFSTYGTAQALLYYSIGLWAYAGVKITVSMFYSLQDTKTPLKISCYSMLTNIILSFLLMKRFEHSGLAMATSLSSALNVFLLLFILRKKIGAFGSLDILLSIGKTILASLVMGGTVFLLNNKFIIDNSTKFYNLITLSAIISSGIFIYIGVSILIKHKDMIYFVKLLKNKCKG